MVAKLYNIQVLPFFTKNSEKLLAIPDLTKFLSPYKLYWNIFVSLRAAKQLIKCELGNTKELFYVWDRSLAQWECIVSLWALIWICLNSDGNIENTTGHHFHHLQISIYIANECWYIKSLKVFADFMTIFLHLTIVTSFSIKNFKWYKCNVI